MKERDIKLLWGRAGAICAICKRRLSQETSATPETLLLGEAAHIVGEKKDGPRGDSPLTDAERDGYTNRILLCPNDHTIVDKAPGDYPVERLHILKRDHELWVEQQLTAADEKSRVAQEIYAVLVDAAAESCDFENWNNWASRVAGTRPTWTSDAASVVYKFRQRVIGAAWPGTNPELERALQTLSICMNKAAQRFLDETEEQGDDRVEVKYYKSARDTPTYESLFDRWQMWTAHMDLLIFESTKAANWVAEVVRRDLNPAFHAISGKFLLTVPNGLGFITVAPQFDAEKKPKLPEGLDLDQPEVSDDDDE